MPKYLQKRRRVWYAVLEIPKRQRPQFKGKPRLLKSLQTESQTEAERRVLTVISTWKALLEAKKNGLPAEDAVKALQLQAEELRLEGWAERDIAVYQEDLGDIFDDDDLRNAAAELYGTDLSLKLYIENFVSATEGTPKTKDMKAADLGRFVAKFPEASDVKRLTVIDWVERDLMERDGLSAATARRIVSTCRGYWAYLERHHGLKASQPFDKVVPSAPRKKTKEDVQKRRKHFTPTDYRNLLDASQQRSQRLSALIQLGAYTGARIEELCSLQLANVKDDRLEIEDAKTAAGWREIPLHPHILGMVAELKTNSEDSYLLSGLTFNKYHDRSNAIGKQFGRLKSHLGYGKDYVFHSFRKGVATQLESAGVPENVSARLLGHDLHTMSYGLYSGGVPFAVLKDAMNAIDWAK